ncbi:MAG: hypothetical protein LBU65_04485 [Planctomycetaceae bacterium]|jgi:hypothetical protein|nr:hypothetical protein [Planctomycetaceae bacterium]
MRINLLFVITVTAVVLSFCNASLFADDNEPNNDITVTVIVCDLENRPAVNVNCYAHIVGPGTSQNFSTRTDSNGKLSFETRVGDFLHVEALDNKGNCSPPALVEITDGKPNLDVNLTLKPAPRISITIKNVRSGKPIVSEPLSIRHKYTTPNGQHISTQSRWVETNDDGIATLYLHSGDYMISNNFIHRDFTVKKDDTEVLIEEQTLRMSRRLLRVQVNDSDGKPVENADVRINPLEQLIRTDRNGQCSTRFESCNALIRAIVKDKDRKTILRTAMKFASRDIETITLTFQPNVTVKGKLIDIDTNRPASNMTVKLYLCSGFDVAGNPHEFIPDGDHSVQTKDDGSFEFEDLPVGAFYTFAIYENDRKTFLPNRNTFLPNSDDPNLFVPNKDVTLPDVKVQCTPPEQHYSAAGWLFRVPETEEQFIQRFSAAIESAALRGRKTLLYFEERYNINEQKLNQYSVTRPFMFSLNPFINNILVRDAASRYERVGGEVNFLNPSDDVVFITKQLDIDLTKEETGLLCILDEQGNLVAKRKFLELTCEDDAGLVDVEKLKTFLENEK